MIRYLWVLQEVFCKVWTKNENNYICGQMWTIKDKLTLFTLKVPTSRRKLRVGILFREIWIISVSTTGKVVIIRSSVVVITLIFWLCQHSYQITTKHQTQNKEHSCYKFCFWSDQLSWWEADEYSPRWKFHDGSSRQSHFFFFFFLKIFFCFFVKKSLARRKEVIYPTRILRVSSFSFLEQKKIWNKTIIFTQTRYQYWLFFVSKKWF